MRARNDIDYVRIYIELFDILNVPDVDDATFRAVIVGLVKYATTNIEPEFDDKFARSLFRLLKKQCDCDLNNLADKRQRSSDAGKASARQRASTSVNERQQDVNERQQDVNDRQQDVEFVKQKTLTNSTKRQRPSTTVNDRQPSIIEEDRENIDIDIAIEGKVEEQTGQSQQQPPDEYTVLRYAQQHGINVETARYYYRLMTGIEWKLGNEYMGDKWADHFTQWIAQRQTSYRE